jgi:hypothetical protein
MFTAFLFSWIARLDFSALAVFDRGLKVELVRTCRTDVKLQLSSSLHDCCCAEDVRILNLARFSVLYRSMIIDGVGEGFWFSVMGAVYDPARHIYEMRLQRWLHHMMLGSREGWRVVNGIVFHRWGGLCMCQQSDRRTDSCPKPWQASEEVIGFLKWLLRAGSVSFCSRLLNDYGLTR